MKNIFINSREFWKFHKNLYNFRVSEFLTIQNRFRFQSWALIKKWERRKNIGSESWEKWKPIKFSCQLFLFCFCYLFFFMFSLVMIFIVRRGFVTLISIAMVYRLSASNSYFLPTFLILPLSFWQWSSISGYTKSLIFNFLRSTLFSPHHR